MNSSHRGSQFERDICRKLSLWWTEGKRDDIFWRTAGSGAMATTRFKKGKKTYGQDGDIHAIDPIGEPLLKLCNIELKRGYSKDTIFDCLDKPKKAKQQTYEKFMEQAIKGMENSDSKYWILITQRNRRIPMVYIPQDFYAPILDYIYIRASRFTIPEFYQGIMANIYVTTLDIFLERVQPEFIKKLAKNL
jgi:hypothetical protein